MPVFGSSEESEDLTAWCQDESCHRLEPNAWACFALPFAWDEGDWRYFTLSLQRTSEVGDPDIFGAFVTEQGAAALTPSSSSFQFQDTSASDGQPTGLRLAKVDYHAASGEEPPSVPKGAMLCVHAYGSHPASFDLRAFRSACPSAFDAHHGRTECGDAPDAPEQARRSEGCSAEGVCRCRGEYARPAGAAVPGLGFESCAARVRSVEEGALEKEERKASLEHLEIFQDAWTFARFQVPANTSQVVIIALDEQDRGHMSLYLRQGAPPGPLAEDHDLHAARDPAQHGRMLQISLDAGHPKFRAGTWFAGLVSRQGATQATLSLSAFDCPFGCLGHGKCQTAGEGGGVGTCACDEGFAGRDCARSLSKMELRRAVQAAPAAFEYAFFDLPELPRGLLQGTGELAVNASFSTSPYGVVAKVHPLLLLRAGNGSDDLPSVREYDHKFVLDEPDAVHALSICPSQLRKGPWRLAIYNPLPSAPMGYNVTVFANGRCLGDCNKHGTCSDEGLCVCDAGWAGGDCSVAQGSCLQGSRRAEARPEAHGTCWRECECDEAGKCEYVCMLRKAFSASKCAGFECDAAPEGELPFRLKGSESACVQDRCSRDEWVQTAAFVCLKPCECPPDGGPCAVAADCRERAELRAPSGGHWGFWMLLLGLLAGAGGLAARIHLRGVPDWLPIRVQPFSSYYAELSDSEL